MASAARRPPGACRCWRTRAAEVALPPANLGKLLAALRRAALAAPVSALDGWWLHLRCPQCRESSSYPLRLLVERHGRGSLQQVVERLCCKRCRRPPLSVVLTDDPTAGSIGALPPSWRVELLPLALPGYPEKHPCGSR